MPLPNLVLQTKPVHSVVTYQCKEKLQTATVQKNVANQTYNFLPSNSFDGPFQKRLILAQFTTCKKRDPSTIMSFFGIYYANLPTFVPQSRGTVGIIATHKPPASSDRGHGFNSISKNKDVC